MPKRTPTALKEVKGSANSTRESQRTLAEFPKKDIYAPPTILVGEGLAKWKELEPMLRNAGVMQATDVQILAQYCLTWAQLVEAEQLIQREGSYILDDDGNKEKRHPATILRKEALTELRSLAGLLGLTPGHRATLDLGGSKDEKKTGFASLAPVNRTKPAN